MRSAGTPYRRKYSRPRLPHASTAEHRRSLPAESVDAKVGSVVDVMLGELADDPDEWWVVGSVPEPPAHE